MLQTFDCPKCGGPVSYETEGPLAARETVTCQYCNSSLMIPGRQGAQAAFATPIKIQIGTPRPIKIGKWIWLIIAIPTAFVVLMFVLGIVSAILPLFFGGRSTRTTNTSRPTTTRSARGGDADGFARVLLKFGSEGIGPGMFKDARSIAVDGAGRIYVGEYTGGRIQVFDAAGKFITQWNIGDRKTILRGLAADRKGIVYVVSGGEIFKYEGETGTLRGKVEYERGGFDDVTVAPDGSLLAASYRNRDDLVRFNAAGQVIKTIPAAISSQSGDSELNTRVAIDGAGNMYALGTFNDGVFKFGSDGKFVNRFGDSGDQPGQFRAPSAIAVDGKGRVFVSDIKGVQVFDGNGRLLHTFKTEGSASGMVFNDRNELFVVARSHVIKFELE